jgi:hypothetical protein
MKQREVSPRIIAVLTKGKHLFHVTYLGAAAWELHGIYSLAAGGLLGIVLVGFITGIQEMD